MKPGPILIALVGGSGAGKSWLAHQLQEAIELPTTLLSLDDFYLDQSHLAPDKRDQVNYDHPDAIDWRLAEAAMLGCRAGRAVYVPRYSFVTHTRRKTFKMVLPTPVILVDGLWLLWRPHLRRLFDLRIYLHCPAQLRLNRRLDRDTAARGRDVRSIRRQFQTTVAPMHKRFVAPQARWADVVLRNPPGRRKVEYLAKVIQNIYCRSMRGLSR
jgi:uridine kinase